MSVLRIILLLVLLSGWAQLSAQEAPAEAASGPQPEIINISASDGLTLAADFYRSSPEQPSVLLLHELYSNRSGWSQLTQRLIEAGFNVLAVDLRGWGQTRGEINWRQAETDVASWLAWLREAAGVRGDGIVVIGSSMGASLALTGCASDADCRSAIALSPGWSSYGISVRDAFAEDFGERPVLLIYTERDRWPAQAIPRIQEIASEAVVYDVLPGNAHGFRMLNASAETLLPRIVDWVRQVTG